MKKVVAVIVLACAIVASPAQGLELRRAGQETAAHTKKKPMPRHWRTWVRIGRCEQPGPGKWGIYWSHPGPTYQGGLGFWYGTWDAYAPRRFPNDAGDATWRQQMKVANRIYNDYGTSAWGCG
jgi:hypothetical protein